MGCAPSCDHQRITLRREERVVPSKLEALHHLQHQPDFFFLFPYCLAVVLATDIETWANSGSHAHQMDLSAFISTSSPPLLPLPEDPPPYTEQILEGHITLMSGAKAYMMDQENSFTVTTDDVSMTDRSCNSTALASLERHIQPVTVVDEGLVSDQVPTYYLDGQHTYTVCMPMSSEYEPIALQDHGTAGAQCISTPSTPPRPTLPLCTVGYNHAFGRPITALPPSIQFHGHHRSQSENCTRLNIYDQPQAPDGMPSIAHSVAKSPTATASPFLSRSFIPMTHISQGQLNFSRELGGEWIANDPFVRRPSRLPPLQRPSQPQRGKGKKKLSHSWHEGSNSFPVSPATT